MQRSALWYLSQIEKYILRPNSDAIAFMQRVQAHVHFRHPSVGVHIRRTDKLDSEAKFHPTEKYYKVRPVATSARLIALSRRR